MVTLFRWDDRLFNVGAVIPPARYGQTLLGIGPDHARWRREIVTEFIRTANFPDRPSRLAGLLAFTSPGNAYKNFATFAGSGTYRLYQVEALERTTIFIAAEWQLYEVVSALERNDLKNATREARRYWEGGAHGDGLMEAIASTGLRVTAILAERPASAALAAESGGL